MIRGAKILLRAHCYLILGSQLEGNRPRISLLISIIARVIYLATEGAFALVCCLLSIGDLTENEGLGVHKEFTTLQRGAGVQVSTRCTGLEQMHPGATKEGARPEL